MCFVAWKGGLRDQVNQDGVPEEMAAILPCCSNNYSLSLQPSGTSRLPTAKAKDSFK